MPTVPVIQTQAANVGGIGGYSAPQAAPVIDQHPQMIQQAGQAMSQSAEHWAQLEAQRKRRADIAANAERSAAIGEQDIEADAAYGRLEGKAAYEGFQGYIESRDKRYKAALESAPEGPQREWLRQHLAQERQRFYNSAVVHREKQTFVWRKASATAEATTAQQKAVSMWASPDADSLVAEARDKWGEIADMDGLDDKAKQQFVSANMSNLHAQTLDVMLNEQRLGQATKYFAENGAEIDPVAKSRIGAKLKAQAIEQGARMLDATVGSYDERLTRVQEMVQDGQLTPEDGESARRHLAQFESRRQEERGLAQRAVVAKYKEWRAQNPMLRVQQDNPELAAEIQAAGVVLNRETSPAFVQRLRSDSALQNDLAQMGDGQLHAYLSQFLSEEDEERETAILRGRFGEVSIKEAMDNTFEAMGFVKPPASADASVKKKYARRHDQFRQYMDAKVVELSKDLGRQPYADEVRKKILTPMLAEKVRYNDAWFGQDTEMPLMAAQLKGLAAVDDPATQANEAMQFDGYGDLYVPTAAGNVYLNQIPKEELQAVLEDASSRGERLGINEAVSKWATRKAKLAVQKQEAQQSAIKEARAGALPPLPGGEELRQQQLLRDFPGFQNGPLR